MSGSHRPHTVVSSPVAQSGKRRTARQTNPARRRRRWTTKTRSGPDGCGCPGTTTTPTRTVRARARASGIRRTRRASNWTVAALIAGVAAATGYFAHHPPAAAPATSSVTVVPGGTAAGPHKPTLNTPVTTSGGSGVTVSTGPGGVKTATYRDN